MFNPQHAFQRATPASATWETRVVLNSSNLWSGWIGGIKDTVLRGRRVPWFGLQLTSYGKWKLLAACAQWGFARAVSSSKTTNRLRWVLRVCQWNVFFIGIKEMLKSMFIVFELWTCCSLHKRRWPLWVDHTLQSPLPHPDICNLSKTSEATILKVLH